MDSLNIHQGSTVYSVDGDKLGKVIGLEGGNLIVEKGWFFPTDYAIPTSLVTSSTEDEIYLSVSKDQALNQDWTADTGSVGTAAMTTSGTTLGTEFGTAPTARTDLGGNIEPNVGTNASGQPVGTDATYRGAQYDTAANYADDTVAAGSIGSDYDAATGDKSAGGRDVLRVPVHEEELTATKRPVEQGHVRVSKSVVDEDRTLEVPVTEERVNVTRRALDRAATDDAHVFEEGTIDVPVRGERVDVQKRVRTAEEVEIAKEPVQRTQRVADTVRREEVHIDDDTAGGEATSS
jgi:uncharacterized protein (TIGR02271 family)